ncbi:MAG: DinB family protein [Dehalococcoidia bacterium]
MDTLEFFLLHHERLHSQIERDFIQRLTGDQMRYRPAENINSIAWLVWHMARCEDLMSFILCARRQVLSEGDWLTRFNLTQHDIGTGMQDEEVGEFTSRVDLELLGDYYSSVGRRTIEVIQGLKSEDLNEVPDSAYLSQALVADGTARENIIDFLIWEREGNTKGWWLGHLGLAHNHLHRGEALTVRGMQGIRNR